ncbi:hypothetical protein CSKR_202872 [Clonorchis sinensis]|uniref:Uncharacterized protein n=1 Tax=Clonorchis sinensis TaxID=79923 RepID=A0A8T1M477_CLOSI|nr:hypothetical protein CSKR_202872 [Clonorchis sinensis]
MFTRYTADWFMGLLDQRSSFLCQQFDSAASVAYFCLPLCCRCSCASMLCFRLQSQLFSRVDYFIWLTFSHSLSPPSLEDTLSPSFPVQSPLGLQLRLAFIHNEFALHVLPLRTFCLSDVDLIFKLL